MQTNCADKILVTVFKIDLVTPAGDPVASPVDSGDGQNEFTYDNANPGVLNVHLKASVLPSGVASQIASRCSYAVSDIATSTKSWAPGSPNGTPSSSNDFLVAQAIFTGLPVNNSAFGSKMAIVSFDAVEMKKNQYEVFFMKHSTNHPNGQASSPNWYYYWSQTSANGANSTMLYTNCSRSFYDYFSGRTIYIANDAALTQIAAWGAPKGIDCFAWTTLHEAKHHAQLTGFWPVNWISSDDVDVDWIPNTLEPNYMPGRPYSPTNSATYPDTIGYGANPIPDAEDINMRSQVSPYGLDSLWSNGSANTEDWSNPGKNSAVVY